jgi:hypothetical protein
MLTYPENASPPPIRSGLLNPRITVMGESVVTYADIGI